MKCIAEDFVFDVVGVKPIHIEVQAEWLFVIHDADPRSILLDFKDQLKVVTFALGKGQVFEIVDYDVGSLYAAGASLGSILKDLESEAGIGCACGDGWHGIW